MQIFRIPSPQQHLQDVLNSALTPFTRHGEVFSVRSAIQNTSNASTAALYTPWQEHPAASVHAEQGLVSAELDTGQILHLSRQEFDRSTGDFVARITDDIRILQTHLAERAGEHLSRRERQRETLRVFLQQSGGTIREREWFEEERPGEVDALLDIMHEGTPLIAAVMVTGDDGQYHIHSGGTLLGRLAYDQETQRFLWDIHPNWPPHPDMAQPITESRAPDPAPAEEAEKVDASVFPSIFAPAPAAAPAAERKPDLKGFGFFNPSNARRPFKTSDSESE